MVCEMLLRAAVTLLIIALTSIILTSASYFRYESIPEIPLFRDVIILRNKKTTIAEAAFEIAKDKVKNPLMKLWMYEGKRALKKNTSLALSLLEKAYGVGGGVRPIKRD